MRTRTLFELLLAGASLIMLVVPTQLMMASAATSPAPSTTDSPSIAEAAETATASVKSAMNKLAEEFQKYSTFAGRREHVIRSLLGVSKKDTLSDVWDSLRTTVHWEDLLLLAILGWFTVPFLRVPYEMLPNNTKWFPSLLSKEDPQEGGKRPFRRTLYFQLADHLQQITKIALAVYCVDIFKLVLMGAGLQFAKMGRFPHAFAQGSYTLWTANRVAALKRLLLRKWVNAHPETFGRMKVLNRLADAVIYGLTIFVLLNILQLQMGLAMQSFLAVGSVGTLAMGLASKGIAQEVINGLMLASSDRIYEGDDVQFGNGESGKIENLGWMETIIRRGDEVMVSIPNSQLLNQKVSNLSRVRMSQVKQVLRVKLEDADKIPLLIDRIKHEIKLACPELITDGTRPFRVYWTAINEDHCEITIDTRFRIKPTGDVYLINKQNVLAAIHRALKRHDIKLVEPSGRV